MDPEKDLEDAIILQERARLIIMVINFILLIISAFLFEDVKDIIYASFLFLIIWSIFTL